MQAIINAINKATKAGVYNLNEVLNIAKQLEQLGEIVQQHQSQQEAVKSMNKNAVMAADLESKSNK